MRETLIAMELDEFIYLWCFKPFDEVMLDIFPHHSHQYAGVALQVSVSQCFLQ